MLRSLAHQAEVMTRNFDRVRLQSDLRVHILLVLSEDLLRLRIIPALLNS